MVAVVTAPACSGSGDCATLELALLGAEEGREGLAASDTSAAGAPLSDAAGRRSDDDVATSSGR